MAECNDSDEVRDVRGWAICKIHDKRVEFYCEDHKVLACSTCAFADHRKCIHVPEIANINRKNQCGDLINELQTAIATTTSAAGSLSETTKIISADVNRMPEKLQKMKESMVKLFDEFANNVTTDAMKYRDQTTAKLLKSKRDCASRIHDMTEALDVIDDIAKHGTESEQFIIERSMVDSVQAQVKDANMACSGLDELNISRNFEQHFQQFESRLASSLKPEEFEMKYNALKTTKLEPITSVDLKQMGEDVGEPRYSGLDFFPDGRLVAVDNQNGKCLLYDVNLRLLSAYKLPYRYPECVVVVSDDEVAITTANHYRLDFLHVSKSNQITLRKTCNVKVSYSSISMKDDDNFVVSTIDHKTPVRIVSKSGAETNFDIKFPSKKYSISTLYSTFIRGQDKIVLSDTDADTIYIYDLKTGRKVVVEDDRIKAPHGLTLGPFDHVFVCSEDKRSLVEITPTGRVVSSHPVDMYYPRRVAVSKDRKRLAVSNAANGSQMLQLYNILI